jgi:hypothetical protein
MERDDFERGLRPSTVSSTCRNFVTISTVRLFITVSQSS